MIWPEFKDSNGEVILQTNCSVPEIGTARMWIIIPERRVYHVEKIKPGLIGYFMEGTMKIGECKVIEIIGLTTNPVSQTK
jgi:hypothetical protein